MDTVNLQVLHKTIKKQSVAAIIGAIVGSILAFVFGLFGVALGIVAIWRSKKSHKLIEHNSIEDKDLNRYATIGLILAWICFALGVLKTLPVFFSTPKIIEPRL